jgi:gliding motility-associated-like protein
LKGNDKIKDLFSEKLGNFESPVNTELWSGISSQIGTTAAQSAAGGMTVLTKTLIGLGIVAATIVTVVIVSNNEEPVKEPIQKEKVVQAEPKEELVVQDPEEDQANNPSDQQRVEPTTQDFEIPDVEVGYVYVPNTQLPVEEFEERITQEDEPTLEVMDEPFEEPGLAEGGPVEEEVINDPAEEITVDEPEIKEVEIVLPNTFTPNNDNRNDFYEIMEGAEELDDFSVFIYNMSGEIVFRSDDPNFKWNGQDLKQEAVPQGKYMCVLIATDKGGNPRKITKQFDLFK